MIFPLLFFSWLAKKLTQNAKAVSLIAAFVVWWCDLIDKGVSPVFDVMKGLLDKMDITALGNVNFASIPSMGYINAVLPVAEFVNLLTIMGTAWVLVVVIRWVKSLVPAWSN